MPSINDLLGRQADVAQGDLQDAMRQQEKENQNRSGLANSLKYGAGAPFGVGSKIDESGQTISDRPGVEAIPALTTAAEDTAARVQAGNSINGLLQASALKGDAAALEAYRYAPSHAFWTGAANALSLGYFGRATGEEPPAHIPEVGAAQSAGALAAYVTPVAGTVPNAAFAGVRGLMGKEALGELGQTLIGRTMARGTEGALGGAAMSAAEMPRKGETWADRGESIIGGLETAGLPLALGGIGELVRGLKTGSIKREAAIWTVKDQMGIKDPKTAEMLVDLIQQKKYAEAAGVVRSYREPKATEVKPAEVAPAGLATEKPVAIPDITQPVEVQPSARKPDIFDEIAPDPSPNPAPTLPKGWTEVVGKTRTKEGHTAEAEVDWQNRRIVYASAEHMANPHIKTHEIAHIIVEDFPKEFWAEFDTSAKLSEWEIENKFNREKAAMDYGEYLANPASVSADVRKVFDKYSRVPAKGKAPIARQPVIVKPRNPNPVELRKLESEIVDLHRQEFGDQGYSIEQAGGKVDAGDQYGFDKLPTSFAGVLPRELSEALQGRKHLRFLLKGNAGRGAVGEDALKTLGTDEYVRRLEVLAGGKKAMNERSITDMEYYATANQDAELAMKISRYRALKAAGGEVLPSHAIKAGELDTGDSFEVMGEKYRVLAKEPGFIRVKDGTEGYVRDSATITADAPATKGKGLDGMTDAELVRMQDEAQASGSDNAEGAAREELFRRSPETTPESMENWIAQQDELIQAGRYDEAMDDRIGHEQEAAEFERREMEGEPLTAATANLFGEPTFEGVTGKQRSMMVQGEHGPETVLGAEHQPNAYNPPARTGTDAVIAEKFKGAQPEPMFQEGESASPMAGGFVALPGKATALHEAKAIKAEANEPRITIYGKQKDINVVQMYGDLGNMIHFSKNKNVIDAGEILLDTPMRMANEIESSLTMDKAFYDKLPKEYRSNKGAKFFELMDKTVTPAEIDALNIPDEAKSVLKHFKARDEEMRLEIIARKRDMAVSMHMQKSKPSLGAIASDRGIELPEKWSKRDAAERLAMLDVPDSWGKQWGHIQHIFFGDYELTFTDAKGKKHFIGRAETQNEAYLRLNEFRKANPTAKVQQLEARPQMNLPMDVVRLPQTQYFNLVKNLKESADLANQEVRDALNGIIGRRSSKQKHWGALLQRTGSEGFSQDFWRVWQTQSVQYNRWRYLSDMNKQVAPLIEKVRGEGLKGWADYLDETKNFVWGKQRGITSESVDQWLSSVPAVKHYVKPFALDRAAALVKTINFWRMLQTPKFAVVNLLQPFQTLWPVIGEKGMYRAFKLYYSKEGQAILREHGIGGASQKLHDAGVRSIRIEKYTPAGWSEARNQKLAFLGVYDHALNVLKMTKEQAAMQGRSRGNLMTQFAFTPADQPKGMRGPILGLIFQYKRWTIKNLSLAARLAHEKNYGGLARWVAAQLVLGGINVYGDLWTYGQLKRAFGDQVADILAYGIPALLGVDISGSISISPVPWGDNVAEKIGNTVLGPTGQTGVAIGVALADKKTAKPMGKPERVYHAVMGTSPAVRQIEWLYKALNKDTSSYDSHQRAMYDLEVRDLWKKALGFRPLEESHQAAQISAALKLKEAYDTALDEAAQKVLADDMTGSEKIVDQWNAIWPESPIRGSDVMRRVKARAKAREQGRIERTERMLPKALRGSTQR